MGTFEFNAMSANRRHVIPAPDRPLDDRLCSADVPRCAIDAVLDEAARIFDHCVLFQVHHSVATVWGSRGWVDRQDKLVPFRCSAVSGNPLELLQVHENFRGNAPMEQAYVGFFDDLGLDYPAQISLTPVYVDRRLVAILYGDAGERRRLRGTEVQDLELAARLGLGLTLVVIKTKIRVGHRAGLQPQR